MTGMTNKIDGGADLDGVIRELTDGFTEALVTAAEGVHAWAMPVIWPGCKCPPRPSWLWKSRTKTKPSSYSMRVKSISCARRASRRLWCRLFSPCWPAGPRTTTWGPWNGSRPPRSPPNSSLCGAPRMGGPSTTPTWGWAWRTTTSWRTPPRAWTWPWMSTSSNGGPTGPRPPLWNSLPKAARRPRWRWKKSGTPARLPPPRPTRSRPVTACGPSPPSITARGPNTQRLPAQTRTKSAIPI